MRVILAFDSFKDSMTSLAAAKAFSKGFRKGFGPATFRRFAVSDGGEGFGAALARIKGGRNVRVRVCDPLGRPITASFLWIAVEKTAVVEMARASGLERLKPHERNPLNTTTYGTGQMIGAALKLGARQVIVGIGGSATNDGGVGMAQALGVNFRGPEGSALPTPARGKDLLSIRRIELPPALQRPKLRVTAACDVNNPMCGPRGAAAVFGPQKGAGPRAVRSLDRGLRNLCRVVKKDLKKNIERLPGAGAAGGLGGGLVAFLDAHLTPGAEMLLGAAGFEKALHACDLVVTGEGRMDGQTAMNKAPAVVARLARRAGVPVVAVCGSLGAGSEKMIQQGITGLFSFAPGPVNLSESLRNGETFMERTAESLGRLLKAGVR